MVVLGASNKPERYSFLAVQRLQAAAIRVIPVHPVLTSILDIPVFKSLADIHETVHTITVYLNAHAAESMIEEMVAIKPQRVIFNPGAESALLSRELKSLCIEVLNACTLVLISTGRLFSL